MTFKELLQNLAQNLAQDLVERDSSEYIAFLDTLSDEELKKHYEEKYKNKFGTIGKHSTRKDMIRYLIKGR